MINELNMWSTPVLSQMYQEKVSHPVLGVCPTAQGKGG